MVRVERGLPLGDCEREPGGEKVEAYSEAAEGCDRLYARETSDWESGKVSPKDCRVLVLKAEAASGGVDTRSVGASRSKDCMS